MAELKGGEGGRNKGKMGFWVWMEEGDEVVAFNRNRLKIKGKLVILYIFYF